jgi:hypothetical protein
VEGFTTSFYANGAGVVDFGSIDEKKYTGDLTYTPVTETFSGWDYWAFTVSIPAFDQPFEPLK